MKRQAINVIAVVFAIASAIAVTGGCSDEELRLDSLEAWQGEADSTLDALKVKLEKTGENDYVTDVTPLPDGKGYVIDFKFADPVTIRNGSDVEDFVTSIDDDKLFLCIHFADGSAIKLRRNPEDIIFFDDAGTFIWSRTNDSITINFPEGFKESDFMALTGNIELFGEGTDIVTKSALRPDTWALELVMPRFENGTVVPGSAKAVLKAAEDKMIEGMLRLEMTDSQGRSHAISRFIRQEIQIGDVLMSSGKLMDPNEVPAGRKKDIIAVVFVNERDRMSAGLQAAGFHHGIAIATRQEDTSKKELHWSSVSWNPDGMTAGARYHDFYTVGDAYSDNLLIRAQPDWQNIFFVFDEATTVQNRNYPAPSGTSGWYLAGIREWIDILQNLGGLDMSANIRDKNYNVDFENPQLVLDKLNSNLVASGAGTVTPFRFNTYYWTATPFDVNAWYIQWHERYGLRLSHCVKVETVRNEELDLQVRSVIAF